MAAQSQSAWAPFSWPMPSSVIDTITTTGRSTSFQKLPVTTTIIIGATATVTGTKSIAIVIGTTITAITIIKQKF
jgi:hypothetical protein